VKVLRPLLFLVFVLPFAAALVLFAVANRAPVPLSLDPFSADAPALLLRPPLFVVAFAALALGVLLGGIASWLAQGKHRRAERRYRREASRLRATVEASEGGGERIGGVTGLPALIPAR